jgi:hypothetical protein
VGELSLPRLYGAVFVSCIVHGGALAWIPSRRVAAPPLAVEVEPQLATAAEALTVVTVLSSGGVTGEGNPRHRGRIRSSQPRRVATSGGASAPEVSSGTLVAREPLRPAITNGASAAFAGDFLAASKPLAVEPPPSGQLQQDGAGMRGERTPFTMHVAPDGTVHFVDKPTADLTDLAMRALGMDPYASMKLRMLDDTREERAALGMRHRKELLARSPELMRNNVDWLWSTTTDPAARKQALFELWDDCAEAGDGDDELVAAGRAARAYVLGVIRSRVHFTDEEIEHFNKIRESEETFAP